MLFRKFHDFLRLWMDVKIVERRKFFCYKSEFVADCCLVREEPFSAIVLLPSLTASLISPWLIFMAKKISPWETKLASPWKQFAWTSLAFLPDEIKWQEIIIYVRQSLRFALCRKKARNNFLSTFNSRKISTNS